MAADPLSLEQQIGRIIETRPPETGSGGGKLYRNALETWAAVAWGELEKIERASRSLGWEISAMTQQLEHLTRNSEELERARGILRAAALGADRELEQLGVDIVRPK